MARPYSPRDKFARDRAGETRIRINDGITVPQVRLIDENGEQLGIKPIAFAQDYAAERNLDLVEVSPNSDPPVCRVMNYSKYRYELELKAKQARKHQSQIVIKEIKFRPKTDEHDYQFKLKHIQRFLEEKNKVKVVMRFRGREIIHMGKGLEMLNWVRADLGDLAVTEAEPKAEGRTMVMMLAPK